MGFLFWAGTPVMFVIYPLIPWIGVMAVGYVFGALYQLDAQRRRRLLLIIGGLATALFIVLRAINIYGDPSQWSSAEEHRLHCAFVFEYDEVSAVAVVPVDDAWASDSRARVV